MLLICSISNVLKHRHFTGKETAVRFYDTIFRHLVICLAPPARRFCARDQTYLGLRCPTSPPAAPAKPRPTPPAPSPRPWQLISMRTSSDISKDGLQRTLRNRYCPPQRCLHVTELLTTGLKSRDIITELQNLNLRSFSHLIVCL